MNDLRTHPARSLRRLAAAVLAGCAVVAFGGVASAQVFADDPVEELEGATQEDMTGAQVDLDIRFVDDAGREVSFADYFGQGRPVLLTLNYFRCPMLCIETLNGLVDGLNEAGVVLGEDYEMVTVSFSEREGPDLAAAKKQSYLTRFDGENGQEHWHFLTGERDQILKLTDQVGFGFRYDERSGEYAHPSTIVFMTPDGRISLYMNDVLFQPRDLRLALVDASEGKIGSPLEKFLLFTCFQWDPEANSYSASAFRLMRFAGLVTVVFLALLVGLLVLRGARHQDRARTSDGADPGSSAPAGGLAHDAG